METKTLILAILIPFISNLTFAKEKDSNINFQRTINKDFKVAAGAKLSINNSYGTITINESSSNIVNIFVEIKVDPKGDTSNSPQDIIDVNFTSTSDHVSATTIIKKGPLDNVSFEINYTITAPKSMNLDIVNKYGNTFLNEVGGTLNTDIKYGNISATKIESDANMIIKYGNINIAELDKNIKLNVEYAKCSFGNVANCDIISKYSDVTISKAERINISETKYDSYAINSVLSLNTPSASYTKFNIDDIKNSFVITRARYCNINAGLNSSFSEFNVSANYTPIDIYVDEKSSFKCNISTKYASIKMKDFNVQAAVVVDGSSQSLNQNIGSNSANSSINITNSYGNITISPK